MSPSPSLRPASIRRIARQLRADPRTIALVLVLPPLLLTLLYFVFVDVPTPPGQPTTFDRVGPIMLAVLPMMMMFVVTSVAMLRERQSGTLERILTTPVTKASLIASYATVFGILAAVQALILSALLLSAFDVEVEGSLVALVGCAILDGVIGVAFGLAASAFARTEFQAVQFMPAFIAPQIFLSGLFVPTDHMPDVLARIAEILPMTWAVTVVCDIVDSESLSTSSVGYLALLGVVALAVLALAAITMPRVRR